MFIHSRHVAAAFLCLPGRSRSMTSSASSPMSSSFATKSNKVSTSRSSDSSCVYAVGKTVMAISAAFAWLVAHTRFPNSSVCKLSVRFVEAKRPPRSAQSATLGNRSVISCKTQITASIGTTQEVPSGTQHSAIHNIDQQNARQLAL